MTVIKDMIYIRPEYFKRGSGLFKNEGPVNTVFLSPYWIDKYPVTNARFKKFVEDGGYQNRKFWSVQGWEFVKEKNVTEPLYWFDPLWNQPEQPVTGVSWWEAMAFSVYEGKTLPTEAQWEMAAGSGTDTYPWGEAPPSEEMANYAPGCEPAELKRSSTKVNAYPQAASRVGCHDMAGNVNEWCIDNVSNNYNWDYYRINPVYLIQEGLPHIVKGGSGLHDEDNLRCASRDSYDPGLRDNIVGFRCVFLGESFNGR